MEGRLIREDTRRTTLVGAKGSLHPIAEHRHVTGLCHHKIGEPVKTSRPTNLSESWGS